MPFIVISPSQVAAKAPVDDSLMGAIKNDLDYLLSAIGASNVQIYDFRVNGSLRQLPFTNNGTGMFRQRNFSGIITPPDTSGADYGIGVAKRLDGIVVAKTQNLTRSKLYLGRPGVGGSLIVDLRKYTPTGTPIKKIESVFTDAQLGSATTVHTFTAQTITHSTPVINTQSIAAWKSALNVQSIIPFFGWDQLAYRQIELDVAPDSDWKVGDSITLSGTASNDGTYVIVDVNREGGPNIVIAGAGTEENTPAGTCTLLAWVYTYTNPVNVDFVAGENVEFLTHTSGGNNGIKKIYATNVSGNNIIVKNPSGVAQAGVAGNAGNERWVVTAPSALSTSNFVVGENVRTFGGSSRNRGFFKIVAVNTGGNNYTVINTNPSGGVIAATPSCTVNCLHFVYDTNLDPSSEVSIGDYVTIENAGSASIKKVVELNHLGVNGVTVYSPLNDLSGDSTETIRSARTKIEFYSDQSAVYSVGDRIEVTDTQDKVLLFEEKSFDGDYDIVEVNHGGGANYNVVIDLNALRGGFIKTPLLQNGACGQVIAKSVSCFTTRPHIDFATVVPETTTGGIIKLIDNGTLGPAASLSDNDLIGLCVDQLPTMSLYDPPTDLVFQIG